jgi:hypothetical protein
LEKLQRENQQTSSSTIQQQPIPELKEDKQKESVDNSYLAFRNDNGTSSATTTTSTTTNSSSTILGSSPDLNIDASLYPSAEQNSIEEDSLERRRRLFFEAAQRRAKKEQ